MIKRGTKVYSIKRYKITLSLREAISESSYSKNNLSKLLGFSIKPIIYKNRTINEIHLRKLRQLINFQDSLEEVKFNFSKNFGKKIYTELPKPIREKALLAEFIGIMLGDGYLGKNVVDISFDKRNIAYQDYVENICKNLLGLKFRRRYAKNTNTAHLYFYSKYLVGELQKYGLMVSDKINNNVGIPEWIKLNKEYSKLCIKGLIDTDGCVFKCKRENRIYINFTNFDNKLFQDFRKTTEKLGYHFKSSNKRNLRLYRKEEVARFINDIKPFKSIGAVGKSDILRALGACVPGLNPGGPILV